MTSSACAPTFSSKVQLCSADRMRSMSTLDSLTTPQGCMSVFSSKEVSESEHECNASTCAARLPAGDSTDMTETDGAETSEEALSASPLPSKEEWRQRRQAKKAQRSNSKRPSYGELLRKSAREKFECKTVQRASSPPLPRRRRPEAPQVPEAPRIIDTREKLATIHSVSDCTSVLTSRQGSMMASLVHSIAESRCHSQQHSRQHSRAASRAPTLDNLDEFPDVMQQRLLTRTTTRDSLPPIGDESESEDDSESVVSDEGSDGESYAAGQRYPRGRPQGDMPPSNVNDLQKNLQKALQEVKALKMQMEEMKWDNEQLQRTNDVLKAFCDIPVRSSSALRARAEGCPAGPPGGSREQWLRRREERRERMRARAGGMSYGAWLQAQHEQAVPMAPGS